LHIHRPEWLSLSLLRFYLVLALTVPILAYTVSALHRWHTADSAPVIPLDTLLAQAFAVHLQSSDQVLCTMSEQEDCTQAVFVHIKPQLWQHTKTTVQDKYLELSETQDKRLLCQHQSDNSLYCLRLKAENAPLNKELLFSLLFYTLLFIAFFIYAGTLFKDAAVLRSSALNEIRHGHLPAFTLSKKSYLEPLAHSLQNMTARIAELTNFQTEIAETICHDIKTPVARMHFIAHQLEKKGDPQTAQQLMRNLAEIESNINEYLMLAQNQYTPDEMTYESFNLFDFLRQMVDLFNLDTQLVIEIEVAPDLNITANKRLLHRALANLLSNAMRYAGTQIKVTTKVAGGYCHIEVHDDGQAAEPNTSSKRPAEAQHHSLGLSIVRRVCVQHNGLFSFSLSSLGGHTATISIPQILDKERVL
jgi:two-component system OmpR family sensor kinase